MADRRGIPALSVVVPCYNDEAGLHELHRRVTSACRDVVGDGYEIVLVNDGSRDRSWPIMRDLAARDPHLVCANLSRNFGHQTALTAGFSLCRGQRILVLDSDLQDPPELLGRMMARMDEGADVVYGQRVGRAGESWFKKRAATAFYKLLRELVDIDIPAETGEFRLMSRRVLDALVAMPEQHRFTRGMISWIGLRQEALTYERDKRFAGRSGYSLRKLVSLAFDAITSFSIRPLRLAAYIGLASGLLALLLLVFVFWRWLQGVQVQGWTSLMGVILLMSSAQLMVLGLIGEYLGRLYIESKRRPLFLFDEIMRPGSEAYSRSELSDE